MRLGIGIVGDTQYRHRDWRRSVTNVHQNLIDCWGKDVSVTTFVIVGGIASEDSKAIGEAYNTNTVISGEFGIVGKYIKLILPDILSLDVDFFICTRPDIVFLKRVCDLNIDFTKFNFLFKEIDQFETHEFVCDNLFAFPKKYIGSFVDAWHNLSNHNPHSIYRALYPRIGKEVIHFITPDQGSGTGANDIYKLDRYDIIPGDLG